MRTFAILLLLLSCARAAASPASTSAAVPVARIDAPIHAVTAGFVKDTIREAEAAGAPLVVFAIDTPGGRLDSTREITQAILASRVPVVGFVSPGGAQAASAGFFVLMACDVAAMSPGTNAGAASPVGASGEDLPATMTKKVTEDATALLRSLVGPRGRPVEPAMKTVTGAVSYSASESLENKLVEVVAADVPDLLKQLDGRTVKRVGKADVVLATKGLRWEWREMSRLQKALGIIAHPAITGLLLLVGLMGLYAEMSHPGAIFPGVLGGICVILALYAMSVLQTNTAGLGLIFLGVLFFFLEVKLAGHGLFALGGGVSIVLGAIFLFQKSDLAPRGELWFVATCGVATALVLAALSWKALSVQGLPERTGAGALVGRTATVKIGEGGVPKVFTDGALWEARSDVPLTAGEEVEITGLDGLSVIVRSKRKES